MMPTAKVLVMWPMHDTLLVQSFDDLDQHLTLDLLSDGLATLDHLSPALVFLLTLGRQLHKLRQALDETCIGI